MSLGVLFLASVAASVVAAVWFIAFESSPTPVTKSDRFCLSLVFAGAFAVGYGLFG